MTEAMPFLQKAILLSYDPRSFGRGNFILCLQVAVSVILELVVAEMGGLPFLYPVGKIIEKVHELVPIRNEQAGRSGHCQPQRHAF